ncbi:MAG TPA: aspartate/glutamate racemase family protein [Solirubrobacteraceae bacterium]|nr:aspartate/glutamate racemase family protein [Solirubrobacteraceae bacterium]
MSSGYVPSSDRRKIGHITPSSNTVLEPLTALMSRGLDDRVSHHFTRVKVEAISLETRHTEQFRPTAMLPAAELLGDAAVDAIMWNGTSGAWNGADADRELCRLITEQTGVPSSTSTLGQLELIEELGVERCGLAVPYTADVTARIAEVYAAEGVQVVASAHGGVRGNREMALVTDETVRALVRAADSPDAEFVLMICTGLAGAHLVDELERELGKPIFDSVAVALWKGLRLVDIEPRIDGWGRLLSGDPIATPATP